MEGNEEVSQLKLMVNQLKELIRTKDEEVQVKNTSVKDAESKLSKFKIQIKAKEAKISSLNKQLKEAQRRNEASDPSSDTNSFNPEAFQKTISEKESIIRQQLKVLKEHEQKINILTKEKDEKVDNSDMNTQRKVEELSQAIVNKDQLIAVFSSQIEGFEKSIKDKDEENIIMKNRLLESETLSQQQKLLLDKLSTQIGEQEEKVAMVTEERSTGITHLQSDMDRLTEEVVSLTTKLQDKEGTITILEDHILQLKREHQAQIADVTEESHEQDELLRTLKRRLHEQEEVMSGKEKVLQLLQDEAADRVQEQQELQKTISILQQNLRETVESKDLLQEALKAHERKSPTPVHQQNQTSSNEEKDQLIADKDGIIAQLSTALQQYEAAYKQTAEQNNALKQEGLTLKEKIQNLEEGIEKWQQLSEDSSSVLESREKEHSITVNNMEETVKNLTEALSQVKKEQSEHSEDNEKRMKTVLAELDSQTLVLEEQTQSLTISKEENLMLREKLEKISSNDEDHEPSQDESIKMLQEKIAEQESQISSITTKSNATSADVENLSSRLQKHDKAYKDLQNEKESLLSDKTKIQEELRYQTIENGKLQIKVEDLEEQIENFSTRIEEEKDNKENLIQESENQSSLWTQERNNLIQELQGVEHRCREEYASRMKDLEDRITDLSTEKESLEKEYHTVKICLEEKMATMSQEYEDKLKLSLENLMKKDEDLDRIQKQLVDERARISESETKILDFEEQINQYKDEKTNDTKRILDISESSQNLEEKYKLSLQDVENLESQLTSITSSNQDAQKRIEELSSLQEKLKDTLTKVGNLEEELNHSKDEVSKIEMLKNETVTKLKDSLKEIQDEKSRKDHLLEEFDVLKQKNKHKEEKFEIMNADLEKVRESNVNLIKEHQDLLQNIEELKKSCNESEKDHENSLEISQNEKLELIKTIQSLNDQIQEKTDFASDLESNFLKLKEDSQKSLYDSRESLTVKQEEISKIREQLDSSSLRLQEAEDARQASEISLVEVEGKLRLETQGSAEMSSQLESTSIQLEKVTHELKENEANVMKKSELLEQMSTQYTSLQSELEAIHTEYRRLMNEVGKPGITEEIQAGSNQGEQKAAVESQLNETEEKLQQIQDERDDAVHEATLLKRLKREHSKDFDAGEGMQFAEEPTGDAHKGGLEYLQSQLEELANEQEQQQVEHQRITTTLNEKIERISSEKEVLSDNFQKQFTELDEFVKSFNEKSSECLQLNAVITEQQRDLTKIREELNKTTKSSESQQKSLHEVENKFLQLQEKHKVTTELLEETNQVKQDLELEVKEVKATLKTFGEQNSSLTEQREKNFLTINDLQQDLDQAMDQVDALSSQYTEDTTKLKSLLREKDKEISSLNDDLAERSQEVTTLSQTLKERNAECNDLNDNLNAQTEKVGQLESLIRQHETELALISELQGEREQAAASAREMSEYINTLEKKSKDAESTAQDLMKKVDSLQTELIEREGALERLSRESSRIQESHQKKEEEKESRLTDTENQILSLQQQLTQAGQTIASLSNALEIKDEELTQLREISSQRESGLTALQEELASMQQLLKDKEESFRQQMQIEAEKLENTKSEFSVTEDTLKGKLHEISNNYSQLKQSYDNQADQVRGLTSHLETQIAETQSHHSEEIEKLQAAIGQSNKEKETAASELFCAREELENLKEKVELLEKWENEAQEKTKLCQELENSCSLLDERLKESNSKLRETEQQNTLLERNLAESSEKATEKERLVTQLDEALTLSTSEIRKLKDALSEESQRQVKEMDSMMSANIEERDDHIKHLESENNRIQETCNAFEKERNEMKQTCNELETEFESARKEHELKLEEESRKHAEDLNVLNSLLEENRQRLQEITEARKQDDLQDEAWQTTCSQLETELRQSREDLENSRLNLSSTMEKEQELTAEISRLNDELNESKEKESEFKEHTAKHEAQMEKVKKIVRGLQIQLKQGKENIAQLEKQKQESLNDSQQSESDLEVKISDMSQRIQELEKKNLVYASNAEESNLLTTSLKGQLLASVQSFDSLKKESEESDLALKEELRNKTELFDSLQENFKVIKDENAKLQTKADDTTSQLHHAESLVQEMEESFSLEQKKSSEILSQTSVREDEIDVLQKQLETFKESLKILNSEKSQLQETIAEKETNIQNISASFDDNQQLKNQIVNLQSTMDEKNSELETSFSETEKYKALHHNLSLEFTSGREQSEMLLSSLKENLTEITSTLFEKERECKELSSALEEKEEQITSLENAVELNKNDTEKSVETLKMKITEIQAELDLKLNENEKLETEKNTITENLKLRDDEISNMNELNDKLQKALSEHQQRFETLSKDFENVQKEVDISQKSMLEKDSELTEMKDILNRKETELNDDSETSKVQVQTMENEMDLAKEQFATLSRTLNESNAENSILKSSLDSALKKLELSENELENTGKILQERDSEMNNTKERNEMLVRHIEEVNVKLKVAEDNATDLQSEIEDFKLSLEEKESVNASLRQEMKSASGENEGRIVFLNSQLEENLTLVEQLRTSTQEKDSICHQLQNELQESSSKIEDLSTRITEYEKQIDVKERDDSNMEGADDKLKLMEEDFSKLQAEIDDLKSSLGENESVNDALKKEIELSTHKIHDQEEIIEEYKSSSLEKDAVNESLTKELALATDKIEEKEKNHEVLNTQLVENVTLVEQLQVSMQQKDEICHHLQKELQESSSKVEELSSKIQENENHITELKKLNEEFQSTIQESSSKVEELSSKIQENENHITELKKLNEEFQSTIQESSYKVDELSSKIQENENHMIELKKLNNEFQSTIEVKDTEIQTMANSVEKLQDEKKMLESSTANLQMEYPAIEVESPQKSENMTRGQEESGNVAKINELSAQIISMESQLEEKSKTLFETQRKLKASLVSRKNVIEKLKIAEKKIKNMEESPSESSDVSASESLNVSSDSLSGFSPRSDVDFTEELNSLKIKNSELLDRIHVLEDDKEQQEINGKESELQNLLLTAKQEIDVAVQSGEEKDKVLQKLEKKLEDSHNAIQVLEDSKAAEINDMQAAHTEAITLKQEEIESAQLDVEKMTNNLTSVQEQVEILRSSAESFKVQHEEKCVELQKLQEENETVSQLRLQLEEDLAANINKTEELSKIQESLQVDLEEKEALISKLETELHERKREDNAEKDTLNSSTDDMANDIAEKENIIKDLSMKITELEKGFNTVQEELKSAKDEHENLTMEYDGLKRSLETEKETCLRKHEEAKTSKDEIVRIMQEKEDMLRKLDNFSAKTAELENEKISSEIHHQEELESINLKLNTLEEERNQIQKKSDENSAIVEIEKIQLLQKSKDDVTKEKEQLQRKLKAALVSRKELILQEKQLKEELEKLKGDCKSLEEYKINYEKSVEKFNDSKQRIDANEAEVLEMRTRREKDIRILKEAQKKTQELQKKNEENSRTFEESKKQIEELENDISELQEKLRAKDSDIATFESCNNDLNDMVTALEAKKKNLEKQIEEDVETIRNLHKQIKNIQNDDSRGISQEEHDNLKDQLESAEWDKDTLSDKVKLLQEEKKEKSTMFDKVLEDFENESIAKQELASRCDDLEDELKNSRFKLDEVQNKSLVSRESQNEEAVILDLREENEYLQDSVNNLEFQLKDLISEKDSLVEKLKDSVESDNASLLKVENEELKLSLESLRSEIENFRMTQVDVDEKMTSDLSEDPKQLQNDVLLAKKTILEETLGQLKVTQPENWEQEPGIKKLIDKLDYLADKAGEARRDRDASEEKCRNAETERSKMKIQLDAAQEEISMQEKTLDQQEEELNALKLRITELDEDSSTTMTDSNSEFLQLKEKFEQLQTLSQAKEDKFKQDHHDFEEEKNRLMENYQDLQSEKEDLESALSIKIDELRILVEQCQKLNSDILNQQDVISNLEEKLKDKDDLVTDHGTESKKKQGEVKSSSGHSFSSVAESYSKLIEDLGSGNLDPTEMQKQHQALVEELVSKEEELSNLKEEFNHLSLAYDEMLQKSTLPPSQALESLENRVVMSDAESSISIEQEDLLRSEVNDANRKATEKAKELNQREELVSELVSDCMRLKTQLEQEKKLSDSFKLEADDLRSQARSLACLRTQYESNENHLKSELAVKDRLLQRQKEELDYSKTEQARLRKEFGAGTPEEVQVVLTGYIEDITNLKSALSARHSEIDEHISRITELEEEVVVDHTEIENLNLKIKNLDETNVSNAQMIQSLQEECESLKMSNETMTQELDMLKEARESLKQRDDAIQLLMEEKSSLEEEIKIKASSLANLQNEMTSLETEFESLKKLFGEKELFTENLLKEKDDALDKLEENTSLLEKTKEDFEGLRSKLEKAEIEISAKDSALNAVMGAKERLSENLAKNSSDASEFYNENITLKIEVENLRKALNETSIEFSSFVETTKEKQKRLDGSERSLRSLTGEIASLEDKYSTKESILDQIKDFMQNPKVATEILVKAEPNSSPAKSGAVTTLSPEYLKEKNPLVRLQRRLDLYEDALTWMNDSKKQIEAKNLELENLHEISRKEYNEKISELEKLESSLLEMRNKLQDSHDEKKDLENRCSVLEEKLDEKASSVHKDFEELRSKLEKAEIEISAKDSALNAVMGAKERLSENLAKNSSNASEFYNENLTLKTEVEKLKKELNETSIKFSSFVETTKEKQKRLDGSERSLRSLTGEIASLEDKYSTKKSILDHIRETVQTPKVVTEILVKSEPNSSPAKSGAVTTLSTEYLKDKNPLVRLQRRLDSYEDALTWMNDSKNQSEEKNLHLSDLYDKLKTEYDGKISKLEEVESSLLEMTNKLQDSEDEKTKFENYCATIAKELDNKASSVKQMWETIEKGERIIEEEREKVKRLEDVNHSISIDMKTAKDHIQELESAITNHIQHINSADQKLHSQNGQLEHLLAERQQFGSQINTLHVNLQEYQSRYAELHAEYSKLAEENKIRVQQINVSDSPRQEGDRIPDVGAPGGPPVNKGTPATPEHDKWQQSLHDANIEKHNLTVKLSQIEDELREEIQRREEVEELLQNLRKNAHDGEMKEVSLDIGSIASDEEQVLLQKPVTVTRKVQHSASSSCSRWLRGRSLRWANPSKSRLCAHFRPLSFQTLAFLYFIALHVLTIKCFFNL